MISDQKEVYEPLGLAKDPINLDSYSEHELLALRARIDQRLPVTQLADINLERELMLQLRAAQALQAVVIDDAEVAANQKAQVMNAVAATIQNLVKMQVEYYTPERLKKIERTLIQLLNNLPDEQTQDFFEQYEHMLKGG